MLTKQNLGIKEDNKMVFVYGAGRSGFIGRCFAQRLMHIGIKSCFVSDAVTHKYTKNDLLILISGSGQTTSPVAIAQKAKEIGGKIVLLTGNVNSFWDAGFMYPYKNTIAISGRGPVTCSPL